MKLFYLWEIIHRTTNVQSYGYLLYYLLSLENLLLQPALLWWSSNCWIHLELSIFHIQWVESRGEKIISRRKKRRRRRWGKTTVSKYITIKLSASYFISNEWWLCVQGLKIPYKWYKRVCNWNWMFYFVSIWYPSAWRSYPYFVVYLVFFSSVERWQSSI